MALDVVTLGSSSIVKGAIKTGIKQGVKAGSKSLAKNTLQSIVSKLPRGGKSFRQFKKSRGGGGLVGEIPLNETHKFFGDKFPVGTEFDYRFIPQRIQRDFDLPNWLVNNTINVKKTNTLKHAQKDKFRERFLPREIKRRLGPGGDLNYNIFEN